MPEIDEKEKESREWLTGEESKADADRAIYTVETLDKLKEILREGNLRADPLSERNELRIDWSNSTRIYNKTKPEVIFIFPATIFVKLVRNPHQEKDANARELISQILRGTDQPKC